MLQAVSALKDYPVEAKDGRLGAASNCLFDDATWKVRWLVIDTGAWLSGRMVLIHLSSIGNVERESRVHRCPDEAAGGGQSRYPTGPAGLASNENDLHRYYGWEPLWGGGIYGASLYGASMNSVASPLAPGTYFGAGSVRVADRRHAGGSDPDPHLRGVVEVSGCHVHAADGDIGHVEDFLVDGESWGSRYQIIDTSNWWVGQHVLISSYTVKEVDCSGRRVRLDVDRAKVKASPSWNCANEVGGTFELPCPSSEHVRS